MAKSIGVTRGSRIRVGSQVVKVISCTPRMVTLCVDHGKPLIITEEERVEIIPKVFVFVGVPDHLNISGSRLAFEAPRDILIDRVRQDHAVLV